MTTQPTDIAGPMELVGQRRQAAVQRLFELRAAVETLIHGLDEMTEIEWLAIAGQNTDTTLRMANRIITSVNLTQNLRQSVGATGDGLDVTG